MNTKRLIEVAGEEAMRIDERYPGYRLELVRCLIQVTSTQDEGLSDKGRRDKVFRIVEALGGKVAAGAGGAQ